MLKKVLTPKLNLEKNKQTYDWSISCGHTRIYEYIRVWLKNIFLLSSIADFQDRKREMAVSDPIWSLYRLKRDIWAIYHVQRKIQNRIYFKQVFSLCRKIYLWNSILKSTFLFFWSRTQKKNWDYSL